LPTAVPEEAQATVVQAPAGTVPEGVLICPDCGAENVPGEVFCDTCGSPLQAPEPVAAVAAQVVAPGPEAQVAQMGVPYCPTCGAAVKPEDTFCGSCGASLAAAPVEEVVPEVEPVPEEPEVEAEPVVEELMAEAAPVEEAGVEVAEVEPLVEEVPIEEVVAEEVPAEEIVVEEVVEAGPAIEAPAAVAAAAESECPVCGAKVTPGQAFCASCGASLEGVATAEVAAPEAVVTDVTPVPAAPEPVVAGPYLEIVESGAQIPLADQAELLIGREDEVSGVHPDIDMTPHRGEEGGISRRHARLVHVGGAWSIVDLDSTNGTYVNGTELQPRVPASLGDGDRLGFGDVEAIFHAG